VLAGLKMFNKGLFWGLLIVVWIICFLAPADAMDTLHDPQIQGEFSAVYKVMKRNREPFTSHLTLTREVVEGEEIYLLKFRETAGLVTEVYISRESLRPLLVLQEEARELVYSISYSQSHADVFVPGSKARKSQKAIPSIFQKLLDLLVRNKRYESADNTLSKDEQEVIEKRISGVSHKILARRLESYIQENEILPSEDRDTEKRIALPATLYAVQSLPVVLLGFPFDREREMVLNVSYLPHPMVIWKMLATNLGEDDVTGPAGTIRCYKIRLQTDEWFSRYAFGDETYFWIRKESPHILVKFTYPFAGETSVLVSTKED